MICGFRGDGGYINNLKRVYKDKIEMQSSSFKMVFYEICINLGKNRDANDRFLTVEEWSNIHGDNS